jgi:hypothetical protein
LDDVAAIYGRPLEQVKKRERARKEAAAAALALERGPGRG